MPHTQNSGFEDFAPTLVADSLRNALRDSNVDVVDEGAPIRAHIVLDEFSSGSATKRFLVGMGAGRSAVDGRLVFLDQRTSKELANVKIRVRGNLAFSSYQGGNTQRRQATNAFEQRLSRRDCATEIATRELIHHEQWLAKWVRLCYGAAATSAFPTAALSLVGCDESLLAGGTITNYPVHCKVETTGGTSKQALPLNSTTFTFFGINGRRGQSVRVVN